MTTSFNKKLESILTNDSAKLKVYVSDFKGNNRYEIDDLLDFRSYLLSQANHSFEDFMHDYIDNGVLFTFSKYFLYPYDEGVLSFLEDKINNDNSVLSFIYEELISEPNVNIMKKLL